MTKKEVVIDVKNVYKTYFMEGGNSQKVLKGINFSVKSGEFVAIMGPSGSGKSTLMNILGCLDKPTSGTYILDGRDVSLKNDAELAKIRGQTIGFVFQNFNLMMKRTIADNVSLPLVYQNIDEKERYNRAVKMLERVNLTGYQDRLPSQISGGMQQRVAIARALINNPAIIFADEPTGNLDEANEEIVVELFRKLHMDGTTLVVVTHNPEVAEVAQRTIVLRNGRVDHETINENFTGKIKHITLQ